MAKVVVLTNRTTSPATVTLLPTGQPKSHLTLAPGVSKPVFFKKALRVRYQESRIQREFELDESNAYFFTYGTQVGSVRLEKLGLGGNPNQVKPDEEPPQAAIEPTTIRVKLLVDDDEPTHRRIWEARIRNRFKDAAAIIERHAGVKMVIEDVSTWDSDDAVNDFNQSLREFEKEVPPQPAQLAIGFSSQYRIARGRIHLGGTRGAFHPHILIKERSPQVREPERLELLVHEIGHYLGAAHSPEPSSVMRPVIYGGKQRGVSSRIVFDPVNTLLLAIVGDEIRTRAARSLSDLSDSSKKRMAEIYGVLSKALPDDPAAAQYQRLISRVTTSPLAKDTRQVLRRLLIQARLRNQIESDLKKSAGSKSKKPLVSTNNDAATNSYVRHAATTAQGLKSGNAKQAFLLSLGIFLDDTSTLRSFPPTARFVRQVENNANRLARLQVLGRPTMRGRPDLVEHFFVSAFTVVAIGEKSARVLGLTKELADAQQGSGFSFADMAANRAGIVFAKQLLSDQLSLETISQKFSCEAFLPPIDDLAENLSAAELKKQYGGIAGEALSTELTRIESLLLALPIYQQTKK